GYPGTSDLVDHHRVVLTGETRRQDPAAVDLDVAALNAGLQRGLQRTLGPRAAGKLEHARRIEDDQGYAIFHGEAGTHGRRKCGDRTERSDEIPVRSGALIHERGALVALAIGLRRVCDGPLAGNQREVAVDRDTETTDVGPTGVR